LQFFYPARTAWDAPVVVGPVPASADGAQSAAIPGPEALDLRSAAAPPESAHVSLTSSVVGSNNWAVAGRHTSTGAALVANDRHLGQRVPVIWYRMRIRTTPPQGQGIDEGIDVTGVTLPGAPVVVAGSNGHIAWGFTNSYGKWLTVTPAPCGSVGDGASQVQWEEIRVRGAASVRFPIRSGPGGVLLE